MVLPLINQDLLNSPIFAVHLNNDGDDGVDQNAFKGTITPVRRRAYWEVGLERIALGLVVRHEHFQSLITLSIKHSYWCHQIIEWNGRL